MQALAQLVGEIGRTLPPLPLLIFGAVLAGLVLLPVAAPILARLFPAAFIRLLGGYGTVYVFQDVDRPEMVKVGTTARASRVRKREVARDQAGGAALRQVFAIDMRFAATVEAVAHRRLAWRRLAWRQLGAKRGREWFYAGGRQGLAPILEAVEAAARDVRRLAQRRRRWEKRDEEAARVWELTTGGARRRPF